MLSYHIISFLLRNILLCCDFFFYYYNRCIGLTPWIRHKNFQKYRWLENLLKYRPRRSTNKIIRKTQHFGLNFNFFFKHCLSWTDKGFKIDWASWEYVWLTTRNDHHFPLTEILFISARPIFKKRFYFKI